ncbi:VanZ family protein [Urechidicola croceus]|uniref:VanZ-like domain-containing protein n=1 Tax=Urechidicola croceus TaxID=1850246 RepID=A0A1D8P8I8_9FLAO|nr:VanZ family protein [Urechidicola croceus]AOW20885.1 hypothetical protein LPB138_09470 [Urechidicola croceus]
MLKRIKNLLELSAYFNAISITLLIVYLSLSSLEELNVDISVSDKLLHTIAYFVLSMSWLFAVKKSHYSLKLKIIIALAILLFGIIIEVLQGSLTDNRHADYYDIIANSTGILIALLIFGFLFRRFKAI